MRRAARIDANHEQVVSALRAAGAVVQSLAAIGKGCPDLLVGFRGGLVLFEVKDSRQPPSKRKLTSDQEEWHRQWFDLPVYIVETPEQALSVLGL